MLITVSVNGQEHTRDVEPRLLLVHFLRDELGLTGTHWGCDTSNCGTCVVLMDGEPVKSCTMLAATAERCARRRSSWPPRRAARPARRPSGGPAPAPPGSGPPRPPAPAPRASPRPPRPGARHTPR